MATSEEILSVRQNTAEPTEQVYSDNFIDGLIDLHGVAGASAIIWEKKAAEAAGLVNVSEAGASHSFSDLHKNALSMADTFRAQQAEELTPITEGRPKIRKITRL